MEFIDDALPANVFFDPSDDLIYPSKESKNLVCPVKEVLQSDGVEIRRHRLPMKKTALSGLIALFVFFAAAVRIVKPWDRVFRDGRVYFSEPDCYYQMRIVDRILAGEDIGRPDGLMSRTESEKRTTANPLFNRIIAGTAKAFGKGHPDRKMVDTVGAVLPGIIGVLSIILVFFVTRLAFGLRPAVIALVLAAVMPGEFLHRTKIGHADHHVLEIFFSLATLGFVVLALKKGPRFALPGGLFLGLSVLNWRGSLLWAGLFLVFAVLQSVHTYAKQEENRTLTLTVVLLTAVACLVVANPWVPPNSVILFVLIGLLLFALIAQGLFEIEKKRRASVGSYAASIAAVMALLAAISVFVSPAFGTAVVRSIRLTLGIFAGGASTLVSEVRPLFMPDGTHLTLSAILANYGIGFFTALVGIAVLGKTIRRREPPQTVMILWGATALILALLQRRFAYYGAIAVAAMTGSFVVFIHQLADRKKTRHPGLLKTGLAVLMAGLVLPNALRSYRESGIYPYAIPPAWQEALDWLKNVSNKEKNPTVLSWWDYGYWLIRESGVRTVCDPGGGRRAEAARFLVSRNDEDAKTILDKNEIRYIVVDYKMPTVFFYALPVTAETGESIQDLTPRHKQSLVWRLYFGPDVPGFRLVFASSPQIRILSQFVEPEVKIFEYVKSEAMKSVFYP